MCIVQLNGTDISSLDSFINKTSCVLFVCISTLSYKFEILWNFVTNKQIKMSLYNFKKIMVVPPAKVRNLFINLSKRIAENCVFEWIDLT